MSPIPEQTRSPGSRGLPIRFALSIGVLTLALLTTRTMAGTVTLGAVKDNTLFEDANGDTSNGAGPALFSGRNNLGSARRALIAFDLHSIPAGVVIDSAVLAIHVSNAQNPTQQDFSLHRLTADWGEGSSCSSGGTGASATVGDATWLYSFYAASLWAMPGGDYVPAASAVAPIGNVGFYAWRGPGLKGDLDGWLSQPASNHGWLLLGAESQLGTARRFDSREAAEVSFRPALTIYYSIDPPVATSWGSIKVRYR